jgi:hypothetical protein
LGGGLATLEQTVKLLTELPCWYSIIAVVASLYFGTRGVVMHRIEAERINLEIRSKEGREWKTWEIVFIRYIQDFIFNFVCSIAGFISLFLSYSLLTGLRDLSKLSAGISLLVVFLFLIGVIGVSGQLPYVILRGKWPTAK